MPFRYQFRISHSNGVVLLFIVCYYCCCLCAAPLFIIHFVSTVCFFFFISYNTILFYPSISIYRVVACVLIQMWNINMISVRKWRSHGYNPNKNLNKIKNTKKYCILVSCCLFNDNKKTLLKWKSTFRAWICTTLVLFDCNKNFNWLFKWNLFTKKKKIEKENSVILSMNYLLASVSLRFFF